MASEKMILIAGPAGSADGEYEAALFEAESVIREMFPDAKVYNPARMYDRETGLPVREYLRLSLPFLIDSSDLVVLLPGWTDDAVAHVQYGVAMGLDIDRVSLQWEKGKLVLAPDYFDGGSAIK